MTRPTTRPLLKPVLNTSMAVFWLAASVYAVVASLQLQVVSRWFPLIGAGVSGICALIVLTGVFRGRRRSGSPPPDADRRHEGPEEFEAFFPAFGGVLLQLATLGVLVVGMGLLGAPLAMLIWLMLYLRLMSRESWLTTTVIAVVAAVVLTLLAGVMYLPLPTGSVYDSSEWVPYQFGV